MKKALAILFATIAALFAFAACADADDNGGDGNGGNHEITSPAISETSEILVVYFSCTQTTETIAKQIQTETKGTLYQIVPQEPYTESDLKYYTNSRSDRENADSSARPAINGSVENMERYDIVFLGYPIWFGKAPKIIYTFLESYDFSGKTIIPFCTSGSSGIGSSATNLQPLAPNAEWKEGARFPAGTPQSTVTAWVQSLTE